MSCSENCSGKMRLLDLSNCFERHTQKIGLYASVFRIAIVKISVLFLANIFGGVHLTKNKIYHWWFAWVCRNVLEISEGATIISITLQFCYWNKFDCWSTYSFNTLSANPTKWWNTLKQFVGFCEQIVWVYLTILWCPRLKG